MAWIIRLVQPGGEESLKPIHLECDVPIQGVVKDDLGVAVVGAGISASDVCQTISDSAGRFTLHGFGPKPQFQFQLRKEGFVFINWGVHVRDDGILLECGRRLQPQGTGTAQRIVCDANTAGLDRGTGDGRGNR